MGGVIYNNHPINYGGYDKEELSFETCFDKAEKFVKEKQHLWTDYERENCTEIVTGIAQDYYFDFIVNEAYLTKTYKRELVFKNKEDANDLCISMISEFNAFSLESLRVNPLNIKFIEAMVQKHIKLD